MSKKIPLSKVQAAVKRVTEKRKRNEVQVDAFEDHLTIIPHAISHGIQLRSGGLRKEVIDDAE